VLDPAWVALSLSRHIGSKTLNALMQQFNSDTRAILDADEKALRQVRGVGPRIAAAIQAIDLEQVEQALQRWQADGVLILTPADPAYPRRLRPLADHPPVLFVQGNWQPQPTKTAAIIGTRTPSPQAVDIAQKLGSELAQRGYAIVSGLATGIDHAAHMGTLAEPDGYPVAVLGGGVLNIYPPSNRELAQGVMQRGALLAEVHPQASVNAASLVARNRIISGLSDAIIVVETADTGGAMYAARFAREQERPVYAIANHASGNQALLADGAIPIPADLSSLDLI
jgi:DNA processing protein